MKINFILLKCLVYALYINFLNSQLTIQNNSKNIDLQKPYNNTKGQNFNLLHSIEYGKENVENSRLKRAVAPNPNLKWPRTIYYTVRPPLPAKKISIALNGIARQTCIKFVKVPRLNGPGLVFYRGDGCWSLLGKVSSSSPQPISMLPKCLFNGVIQHETLHALGLDHEMSRRDRGHYITINFQNAAPGFKHFVGFDPNLKTYNLKYDYGSVMHYNRFSSSVNGRITIMTRNMHYLKTIGQVHAASFKDIKLVNLHYCSNVCQRKLRCFNNGYTNPNNCSLCKCPTFFAGKLCNKLKRSQRGCPKQNLISTVNRKNLSIQGIKSCIVRIIAPKRKRVKLHINNSQFTNFKVCEPFKGLEVKFLLDKSVTGARFCGSDRNKLIVSPGNSIILHYRGFKPTDKISITYKTV
uniref:Zinc metalloproteinase n=1 Tax=Strongyloides stercoralis TaxID=6248 RepID=A0A0K0EGV7_STRER